MNLPSPPSAYDRADQTQTRDAVRRADNENHKRGRDLEIGTARLILTDAATGQRYALSVTGGALDLDLL